MPRASDMKGRAVLVTGAAAGLGRASAQKLAAAGADICLLDLDPAGLQDAADAIARCGAKTLVVATDLAQHGSCMQAVEAAVARFGRLDALINVAGVMLPCHSAAMPVTAWQQTIAVNLSAPFHLFQAAVPHLLKAHGAVVNVTSCAAFQGQAYLAAYGASKAALNYMTRSLALEYMHQPIRINAVAPGGMMTALAANMASLRDADPVLLGRIRPLRGPVQVEEVADFIAFLASDAAQGFHGAIINLDNGISAG